MDPSTRYQIKVEIETFMNKYPGASIREVRQFLKSGSASQVWNNLTRQTRSSFLVRNYTKCQETGSSLKHRGFNGRKKTPESVQKRVKKMLLNKKTPGLRKVAATTGVCVSTARNILKSSKAKPYHKYRTQKINDAQKEQRVKFSKYLLQRFGSCPRIGGRWHRLINTDFSAKK